MQYPQCIQRLQQSTDVLLRVLTLAVVSSLASTALAATFCPAPGDLPVNVGPSPAGFPTNYDSAFSSIVHGNFTVDKSTETEGRVAVGGNYYQSDTTFYGIGGSGGGSWMIAPPGTDNLIVQGDLYMGTGNRISMFGNVKTAGRIKAGTGTAYGTYTNYATAPYDAAGSLVVNPIGHPIDSVTMGSLPVATSVFQNSTNLGFDFAGNKAQILTTANTVAALPATGSTTITGNTLTLVGTGASTEVFNVGSSGAHLANLTVDNFALSGTAAGATIIINYFVDGTILWNANDSAIPLSPVREYVLHNSVPDSSA